MPEVGAAAGGPPARPGSGVTSGGEGGASQLRAKRSDGRALEGRGGPAAGSRHTHRATQEPSGLSEANCGWQGGSSKLGRGQHLTWQGRCTLPAPPPPAAGRSRRQFDNVCDAGRSDFHSPIVILSTSDTTLLPCLDSSRRILTPRWRPRPALVWECVCVAHTLRPNVLVEHVNNLCSPFGGWFVIPLFIDGWPNYLG